MSPAHHTTGDHGGGGLEFLAAMFLAANALKVDYRNRSSVPRRSARW